FADAGFRIVTSKLKKAALAKLPPQIADMLNILEALRASATTALPPHQLAVHTIAALQRRLDQYKRGHGLMSFEDMLTRMDQGLDPAHNPGAATLVGLLRDPGPGPCASAYPRSS